jgi:signal transduction histidine kinase
MATVAEEAAMTGRGSGEWLDSWGRRWPPAVTVGPYVLLGVLAALTAWLERSDPAALLVDLGLCALAAAWMLGMFTLRLTGRERVGPMAVFLVGLLVIAAVLVVRNSWFGFFTPALYLFAFRVLPGAWELPGVAAVAVVAGTAQAGDVDWDTPIGVLTYLAVVAANVLPMCGFAWYIRRVGEQQIERQRALEAAAEANCRLEASLEENAALQRRLLTQAREAGVLDERRRMAREIHDTLAQGLTGIITQLQAAERAAPAAVAGATGWQHHFAAATALARESLNEARRSVHALRPQPLEVARLGEAVADVADRWSARHGVAVQVSTTGSERLLPAAAEDALLRTAQEALANVARHAAATRVGVTLSYLDRELALDVRDDGRGFDAAGDAGPGPRTGSGGGFGLLAMRQRIEALSGTLQVESERGTGTAVSARVPTEPAR